LAAFAQQDGFADRPLASSGPGDCIRIDDSGAPATSVRHEHSSVVRLSPMPLTSQLSLNNRGEAVESTMCDPPARVC
jgi:hypothetical protein